MTDENDDKSWRERYGMYPEDQKLFSEIRKRCSEATEDGASHFCMPTPEFSVLLRSLDIALEALVYCGYSVPMPEQTLEVENKNACFEALQKIKELSERAK